MYNNYNMYTNFEGGRLTGNMQKKSYAKHKRYGNVEDEYWKDFARVEQIWYRQLYLMATSMFSWSNLPGGIDARYIERILLEKGTLAWYFSEEEGGLACSQGTPGGMFNKYYMPLSYWIYNPNTLSNFKEIEIPINNNRLIKDTNVGVLMLNNDLMLGEYSTITYWARQLADIEMVINQNLRAQAQPYFIRVNNKNKLSFAQTFKKIFYGEPYILASKDLNPEDIQVFNTQVPYNVQKSRDEFYHRYSLALTSLGIQNISNTKRQHMVVDEVNANNGQIEISAQIKLRNRQAAVELINDRFKEYLKEPIKVELKENIQYDSRPKGVLNTERYDARQEEGDVYNG